MIEMLSLLVTTASALLGVAQHRQGRHTAQHHALALLFDRIASTIGEAASHLRRGDIPHGSCAEMYHLAEQLPAVLSGVVSQQDAAAYTDALIRAHQVEQLYMTVQHDPSALQELERAAAYFRAASCILAARANA